MADWGKGHIGKVCQDVTKRAGVSGRTVAYPVSEALWRDPTYSMYVLHSYNKLSRRVLPSLRPK